ncbi:MAG TPA: hypothetical protein VGC63_02435 [Solirubrobacterales bacterium]
MGAQVRGLRGRPAIAGWARFAAPALVCLLSLGLAPPALATFHEMSIREVYPGGANDASYVELQMWAGAQNFVATHRLVAYNADGSVNDDFALPANVASGANQATILVADSQYFPRFDEKPAPDASDAQLNLSPAGGAVCWIEGAPPDCLAWGDFSGPLPSHVPALKVGNPASPSGVSAGKALRRSIANGCATFLDPPPTDDSDDSATDFNEVEPAPRDNATTPVEHTCPPVANTTIDTQPTNPSKVTTASFTYHATPAGEASFECRLDGAAFASCPSAGIEYEALSEASHSFEVRAVNPTGTDPTPASWTWTVDTTFIDETPPNTTIVTKPPTPSPNTTAGFTYKSSEPGSSFECALDGAAFASCPTTGITFTSLGIGAHTFKVRAVDPSDNKDPSPAEYGFEIVAASTPPPSLPPQAPPPLPSIPPPSAPSPQAPPQTLLSEPARLSQDRTPTFRFHSATPGATFQCKLDGGPFRSCHSPLTTKLLSFGPHTLKVRALSNGVTDPTPAVLRFKVAQP